MRRCKPDTQTQTHVMCEVEEEEAFSLRADQARTVAWMLDRERCGCDDAAAATPVFGGVLADEVGSGKTFAVIGLLLEARSWPTLLVVPKSLVFQWSRLLIAAGIKDVCAVTSRSATAVGRSTCCKGVVLVTQGVILEEPEAIVGRVWDRVVVDEAHCAKNPRSKTHRVLRGLRAHAKWAITATPIQNHEGDLLALARIVGADVEDAAVARALVRAKDDVRKESEAAGGERPRLPALEVRTVRLDLDRPGEAETYAEAASSSSTASSNDRYRSPSTLEFERTLRCRLAATHPALFYRSIERKAAKASSVARADELAASPAPEVSSKFAFLSAELARTPRGEKTIVFCDWLEEMRLVEAEIVRTGVSRPNSVFLFHGGLSADERDDVVSAFGRTEEGEEGEEGEEEDRRVLIAQIRCAGVGLNLQCASRAFLMRPQWNPTVEQQAIGRLHRSGQTREVTVFRLVANGTVDEECLERQVAKLACIERHNL